MRCVNSPKTYEKDTLKEKKLGSFIGKNQRYMFDKNKGIEFHFLQNTRNTYFISEDYLLETSYFPLKYKKNLYNFSEDDVNKMIENYVNESSFTIDEKENFYSVTVKKPYFCKQCEKTHERKPLMLMKDSFLI